MIRFTEDVEQQLDELFERFPRTDEEWKEINKFALSFMDHEIALAGYRIGDFDSDFISEPKLYICKKLGELSVDMKIDDLVRGKSGARCFIGWMYQNAYTPILDILITFCATGLTKSVSELLWAIIGSQVDMVRKVDPEMAEIILRYLKNPKDNEEIQKVINSTWITIGFPSEYSHIFNYVLELLSCHNSAISVFEVMSECIETAYNY